MAAVVAAMLLSAIQGAGTAMAGPQHWERLSPSPYRLCGETTPHETYPIIAFQVCMRFAGPGSTVAYPELVVANTSERKVTISGTLYWNWPSRAYYNEMACAESTLGGPAQVVCSPPESTYWKIHCGRNSVIADLIVNGAAQRSWPKNHDWYPPGCPPPR